MEIKVGGMRFLTKLKTKPCGWLTDHMPHHIIQKSTDSFNCPGYDIGLGQWKVVEFDE